ncbi:MAG TPA: TIGR03435 family protein [Bryobacteraceae bacterium]|nr:TIGR03435 family protein [Bryobacteraceae bacterium]
MAAGCMAQDRPTFEAASIKPAAIPPGGGYTKWLRGGPGTADPTRIDYHNATVSDLIRKAYGVESYQIVGPEWLQAELYQIAATVAPGSTKEQFQAMLRNLLADRFKVQLHRDRKEMESYSLTVARSGVRFKAHMEGPPDDKPQSFGSKTDSDGYPLIPRGAGLAVMNGRARAKFPNTGVDTITGMLTGQLHSPVSDDTGLTGKYDFELFWSTEAGTGDNGPDLIAAVQEQLGLKLQRKKAPVEVVVVDHAEKTPAEN